MNEAKEMLDKWLIEQDLGTYKELAKFLGVAQNTLDVWKQRGKIPEKNILKYTQMLKNEKNTINIETQNNTIRLPLVKNVRARGGSGNGLEGIDNFEVVDTMVISRSFLKTPPSGTIRVIGIEGYSMVPMLYPDTFVIFDENQEWRGDGLYILNWRNELMVKLLQIDPKGALHIKSVNKDYESWTVDPDDQSVFSIVGKVLRIII